MQCSGWSNGRRTRRQQGRRRRGRRCPAGAMFTWLGHEVAGTAPGGEGEGGRAEPHRALRRPDVACRAGRPRQDEVRLHKLTLLAGRPCRAGRPRQGTRASAGRPGGEPGHLVCPALRHGHRRQRCPACKGGLPAGADCRARRSGTCWRPVVPRQGLSPAGRAASARAAKCRPRARGRGAAARAGIA